MEANDKYEKAILGAKLPKLVYSPSYVALAFRNVLEYCNADKRISSG